MEYTNYEFPLLSKQYSLRDRPERDEEVTINGAKVVFDVEAELMPVTLEVKKDKNGSAH